MITKFEEYLNENLNEGFERFAYMMKPEYRTKYVCEPLYDERPTGHVGFTFEEKKYVVLYTNQWKYARNITYNAFDYKRNGVEFQVQKVSKDKKIFYIIIISKNGRDEYFKANSLMSCFRKIDESIPKPTPLQRLKNIVW
jgi:hypothetical protein